MAVQNEIGLSLFWFADVSSLLLPGGEVLRLVSARILQGCREVNASGMTAAGELSPIGDKKYPFTTMTCRQPGLWLSPWGDNLCVACLVEWM